MMKRMRQMNTMFLHWIFFLNPVVISNIQIGWSGPATRRKHTENISSKCGSYSLILCSLSIKCPMSFKSDLIFIKQNCLLWLWERLPNESNCIQNELVNFNLIFEFENTFVVGSSNVFCELLLLMRDLPYKYSPNCSQHRRQFDVCLLSFLRIASSFPIDEGD